MSPKAYSFLLLSACSLLTSWPPGLLAQTPGHADDYEVERFPAIGSPVPAWADKRKKRWPVWAFNHEGLPMPYGTFLGLEVMLSDGEDNRHVRKVIISDDHFRTPEGFDMCTTIEDLFAAEDLVVEVTPFWHLLYFSLASGWKVYFERVHGYGYRIHYFYNGTDPVTYPIPE